ncbi:MAG: RodZ domain-containing protein, partial [Burkholderiales bacterium]
FFGAKPAGTSGPLGHGSTRVTTLMLNAIKDFNAGGNIKPYVGVGVGAARVDSNASSLYKSGGLQSNGFDDSDTNFAYNALVGVGFKLSERLTADLGYTYTGVDDLKYKGVDGRYNGSYNDHAVTFGLRWQFAAPPPPAPPPPPPPPSRLTVKQEAWVDVRQADGKSIFMGLVKPAAPLELKGTAPYALTIGNASAVTLEYEGTEVDLKPSTSMPNNIAKVKLQ